MSTTLESLETRQKIKSYIDLLSPSTVYYVIGQTLVHIQKLSKVQVEKELSLIQRFSVKSILKKIWTSVVEVIEKSTIAVSGPLKDFLKNITFTFDQFKLEEQRRKPKSVTKVLEDKKIPKISEALGYLKKNYMMAKPTVVGFRGARDGASLKDYSYNARLFKQDDVIMLHFSSCIKNLFNCLSQNDFYHEIIYPDQGRIKEYATAITFDDYLICFGITHIKKSNSSLIQEKDLFPYAILFKQSQQTSYSRILSREVTRKNAHYIFNEEAMTLENMKYFYESLYLLLHQLPVKIWKQESTQACLRFLIQSLNEYFEKDDLPLYLTSLPEL